jgi:hypothetical protein
MSNLGENDLHILEGVFGQIILNVYFKRIPTNGWPCQGSSRVLRVSWLDSQLSLVDVPSRDGALGVIGVSGMANPNL